MIYFDDNSLIIRDLAPSDVDFFVAEECRQGWHSTPEKLLMRLRHAEEGKCIALAAELSGKPAGYVNLYYEADGAFEGTCWPMIVDFTVLEIFRNKGIGTKLMDVSERLAAEFSDNICLGVGLNSDYGSAQRMYIKRGYIPDGSGVWYRGRVCEPYGDCCNDDDLVLYFSKKLK